MAAKYSAQWWNDQARGMKLTKDAIEMLTGLTFATKWNDNNTIAQFWYKDVEERAPGFKDAKLVLDPGTPPSGFDVHTVVGQATYPTWAAFVSAVGNVAPGANAAWDPALSGEAPAAAGHEERIASLEERVAALEEKA
jgi:hypothetical protein